MSDKSSATSTAGSAPSKKALKKEEKKAKKDEVPATAVKVFLTADANATVENVQLALTASYLRIETAGVKESKEVDAAVLSLPAIKDADRVFFGATASIHYLLIKSGQAASTELSSLLLRADQLTSSFIAAQSNNASAESVDKLRGLLEKFEAGKPFEAHPVLAYVLYPVLYKALQIVTGVAQLNNEKMLSTFPYLVAATMSVHKSEELKTAQTVLNGKLIYSSVLAASSSANSSASAGGAEAVEDVPRGVLPAGVNFSSLGLISSLRLLFNAAIVAAYPQSAGLALESANVVRCANPAFGDFQCNNALALSKALKTLDGFTGKTAPRDIADRIARALPENPLVAAAVAAPNGFINITLAPETLTAAIASVSQRGPQPPTIADSKQTVLVDFSSPNIAKEMHVGHLRSTIIGDCVARLFEFLGFNVHRVNHVGDWGTQFGMLITYLLQEYPDILTNPPNISDLTAIYKESKRRFDADEQFKETSRLNVVKLQSGEPTATKIWQLLCDISRKEFQNVYDLLKVTLDEYGESFYNSMIPAVIDELDKKGFVETDAGMLTIKLPHFTIPLIVRKSDGGYGYDSTDMAALKYRLFTLLCDRVVIITDAGQAPHFHMCFDAGKAAHWLEEQREVKRQARGLSADVEIPLTRLDHIGFGVVCGEDGKRFKTRSSETVRLIDLLNAAKEKMRESLLQRQSEGKGAVMTEEEFDDTCARIGYGAVKYFDLKQHPGTNYIFNYDRMLDTKGDTAVYLMFAYARLVSILKKAKDEKHIDISTFLSSAEHILTLSHPAERALAFEILQFGDVVQYVLQELLPNRLCDYLKEVSVKFTDFVTKCHVLNADDEKTSQSRLLLCEATRQVMFKCFDLLGIQPVDRI